MKKIPSDKGAAAASSHLLYTTRRKSFKLVEREKNIPGSKNEVGGGL